MDVISVTGLQLRSPALEEDLWLRTGLDQPLVCSLDVDCDVLAEAKLDQLLTDSLNYGSITKALERHVRSLSPEQHASLPLEVLADRLARVVLFDCHAPNVRLNLERPRALLNAQAVGVSIYRTRTPETRHSAQDKLYVRQLSRQIIIGLNPQERLDQQTVLVDLEFTHAPQDHDHDQEMLPVAAKARPGWRGWRDAVKRVENHLSTSKPLTIEHLVVSLASVLVTPHRDRDPDSENSGASQRGWDVPQATVRVSKPAALLFAQYPSVSVTRTRDQLFPEWRTRGFATAAAPPLFPQEAESTPGAGVAGESAIPDKTEQRPPPSLVTAYIGLGTNLGARPGNLNDAVSLLDRALGSGAAGPRPVPGPGQGQGRIVETSWMYESEAMYHEDQDKFLNAAIKVETTQSPLELLGTLKRIERDLGRDFGTFRNGPRVIDLDLLLYGDDVTFDSSGGRQSTTEDEADKGWWLKVPHQSIQEREFVLRPLADIAPKTLVHPILGKSIAQLLADLVGSPTFRSTVHRVFPLSRTRVHPYSRISSSSFSSSNASLRTEKNKQERKSKTLIMSILNATPDSFSDGNPARATDAHVALREVEQHLAAGADLIDVGGMSTRPHAQDVSPADERDRVVRVVEAIRALPRKPEEEGPIISVDTFRPCVARAALRAGADLVNDVYGGREPGMLQLLAEAACPVVLMHSRGTPSTMNSLTDYSADGGVVPGVRRELAELVDRALANRVRRWNILLDPGLGFAKTGTQNLVLLRSLDQLFAAAGTDDTDLHEYPVLVGLSRKKFLAPEKPVARDRRLETAAGVACAVQSARCEIVRVHDTADARDVVAFSDRLLNSQEE